MYFMLCFILLLYYYANQYNNNVIFTTLFHLFAKKKLSVLYIFNITVQYSVSLLHVLDFLSVHIDLQHHSAVQK